MSRTHESRKGCFVSSRFLLGRRGLLGAAGLFALASLEPRAALAGNDGTREFHAYSVQTFEKIGTACDGNDLDHTHAQAENYDEVFDDWVSSGDWGESLHFLDDGVDGRDFTDSVNHAACSSWQSGCSTVGEDEVEGKGADSADVVFLSSHGGYSGSGDSVSWKMGYDGDDCSVTSNAGTDVGNMYWDGDAEVLIIDACNSARFGIWEDSVAGSPNEGFTNMLAPGGTMNTLLGYHGLSPDRTWGKNFAEDVYDDGLGEDWVIEGTDFAAFGGDDTCAVAVIFGDDAYDREHLYEWGGFNDREATGDPTVSSTYFYVEGCDPASANAI